VIAEFGGGASAPKNLGAYRAGAGYVPSGAKGGSAAIPTPNGSIPSVYPLNLGSFPGAKKELTVTQYWPYKSYYMRNYQYWNTGVPSLSANNGDPTGGWDNINGSNAKYMNNQVLWQQKKFTGNSSNASLPDSGQCTVIYLVNNGSFSNVMSSGTGLSVRGLDATGVLQHMTPIATGKYNYVTSGSTSQLAMSYASYNCSMKKITDIFTAMTDGSYSGTWDMLIILPGLKKVKEAPVTPDDTGYDIKPSAPIGVDEVVFGMRYDGAGNYQIQYQNQTFPNGVRNGNWWYNNGAFDIEANTGVSATTLTTQVPQDAGPSHVWIVMNDQTGAVYSAGVNPIWGTWPIMVSSGQTASFTVKRNGAITASKAGVNMDIGNGVNTGCPENWYMGTTLNSMPGDNYWVRVAPQSSSQSPTGPTGFVPLTSDQTWSFVGNGSTCIVDISIADNAAGNNPKYLGYVVMALANTGGGGGGGGSVSLMAFMPNQPATYRAKDMAAGDELVLLNSERNGTVTGSVVSNRTSEQNLVRLVSESGITLTCSDNTPLTLENGESINSTDALGVKLPVQDDNGFRWETITAVQQVGRGLVATIYCDNQCYGAGDVEGRYIWTHNLQNSKV
jgi:hypothetical protein